MVKSIGIDVGTDSLGISWVDTLKREIIADVRIFAPGVDEKKRSRNEARRKARALRRLIHRRSARKSKLRRFLQQLEWLPSDPVEMAKALGASKRDLSSGYDPEQWNPWLLRSQAPLRTLSTYELGRVFVHLNQRRGYRESEEERERRQARDDEPTDRNSENEGATRRKRKGNDSEGDEAGKVKAGLSRLETDMKSVAEELGIDPNQLTYGQFMAHLHYGLARTVKTDDVHSYREPIRNRLDSHTYHAPRELIIKEFRTICDSQAERGNRRLARGHEVRESLEQLIFFQRPTYWKRSSLQRCELVPTDERVFKADRHAQEFRVLETVNRLKIGTGKDKHAVEPSDPRRAKIIEFLSTHQKPSLTDLLNELELKRGSINLENEKGDRLRVSAHFRQAW